MSSTMTALATMWLVTAAAAQATPARPGDAATPAPAPGAPAAPVTPTRHRVTWDRSTEPDVSGYVVSWGDRPGVYTQSKRVAAQHTSTELELAPGTAGAYVAIRAVDHAGVLSGYSNEIAIGKPGKVGKNTKAGGKQGTKAKAGKKSPKTAEEKAELRRKKQERKKQRAAARAQAAKPKPKP